WARGGGGWGGGPAGGAAGEVGNTRGGTSTGSGGGGGGGRVGSTGGGSADVPTRSGEVCRGAAPATDLLFSAPEMPWNARAPCPAGWTLRPHRERGRLPNRPGRPRR